MFPPSSLHNTQPVYLGTTPGRGFVPQYREERGINYFLPKLHIPFPLVSPRQLGNKPWARVHSLPGAPLVPGMAHGMQPPSRCSPGLSISQRARPGLFGQRVLSTKGANSEVASNYTLSPAALHAGSRCKLDPFYSSKQQFGHPELSRSNKRTQRSGCSLGRG